jgi:TolB-like protein
LLAEGRGRLTIEAGPLILETDWSKRRFIVRKAFFVFVALVACSGLSAQQRPVVAVAPFDAISGIGADEANGILRVFNIRLANSGAVALVDRNIVDRVIREHRFQAGDWSDTEKTAELGKAMNADWLVRGEIERFGSNILVTVSFYDIQSFRLVAGTYVRYPSAADPFDHIEPLVDSLVRTIGTAPAMQRSDTTTPSNKTYNIGDFGPAGGIIFYDKGVFSNGWRYMEAAPTEIEFTAQWGAYNQDVAGTGTAVGNGKRNTQLIVEHLNRSGERGRAAQLVADLNFDGFTDWFLPSKDELNLMYVNLQRNNLGGFTSNWYWSSSQSSADGAWGQNFGSGGQHVGYSYEYSTDSVRAVRAFNP